MNPLSIMPFKLNRIVVIPVAAFLLSLLIPVNRSSYAEESLAKARALSESGEILSLEKIIAAAKSIKPGNFLEIELERKNGSYIYEVEMLDMNGQVWELKFNANSGELIKLERDD
jgi:uncharacterized membrane protein YkoI